jgi:hypothetical protein
MSTAASLLSVVKPRYIEPVGESQLQKVMLASFVTLWTRAPDTTACQRVAFHQKQRETCTQHNQELCSQLTMSLSISPVCYKQRIERIKW